MKSNGNFFLSGKTTDSKLGVTFQFTSAGLHILAMAFMLLDHLWALFFLQWDWMTCVGRIAFPIFAFMVVEGYFHTKKFSRYMLRLLLFALLSEIPFNLMYNSSPFYPFHQNVLWTFLLALSGIWLIEKVRSFGRPLLFYCCSFFIIAAGWILGTVCMVDYYGTGVCIVLLFYFFRGRSWWCFLGQLLGMYLLNVKAMGGLFYPISILGLDLEISQQGFALLALIPIWLYKGHQGLHTKPFQYICYAFYPVHMLILFVIRRTMSQMIL